MRTFAAAFAILLLSHTSQAAQDAEPVEPPPATPIPELTFPSFIRRDESPPSRAGTAAYVTGLSIFSASYIPMSIYGADTVGELGGGGLVMGGLAQMPVAGPLTMGALLLDDLRLEREPQAREGLRTMAALYLADAVAQALGLTLTIIGHVQRAHDPRPRPRPRRVAIAPSLTGPGAGLSLTGTF